MNNRAFYRKITGTARAVQTLKSLGVEMELKKVPFAGMAYRHEVKLPCRIPAAIAFLKQHGSHYDRYRMVWVTTAANTVHASDLVKAIRTAA